MIKNNQDIQSQVDRICEIMKNPEKAKSIISDKVIASDMEKDARLKYLSNLESSYTEFKKHGYLPLKIEDISNLCTSAASYISRIILVQMRIDYRLSNRITSRSSRLATRGFKFLDNLGECSYIKYNDLFSIFIDEKRRSDDPTTLYSQFDFDNIIQERYVIKKLLEHYKIQCDIIPDMIVDNSIAKFTYFRNALPGNTDVTFKLIDCNQTFGEQSVEILEAIYTIAIFCEKLFIKGAAETSIAIKIPEFSRLLNIPTINVRRIIELLESCALLVKSPFSEEYKLILDDDSYKNTIAYNEKQIESSGRPIVVSDVEKGKINFNTSYQCIIEGKELEEKLTGIHETLARAINAVSDMSAITAALRKRDEILYYKSVSEDAAAATIKNLQDEKEILSKRNESLSADVKTIKQMNTNLRANAKLMGKVVPEAVEDAVNDTDTAILAILDRYKERIMHLVRAEMPQNRADQVNKLFVQMNKDVSRATQVDVKKFFPALATDRLMSEDEFRKGEK